MLYEQDYLYPICREFVARQGAKEIVHQIDCWAYQARQMNTTVGCGCNLAEISLVIQDLQIIWEAQIPRSAHPTVDQLQAALEARERLKSQKLYPLLSANLAAQILQ